MRVGVCVVNLFLLHRGAASSRDELRAALWRPRCSHGFSATCPDQLLEDVVGLGIVLERLKDSDDVRMRVSKLEETLHLILLALHVCVSVSGSSVSPLLVAYG